MMMAELGRPITVLRPFNAFGPYQSTRGRCRDNHDLSEQCPGASDTGDTNRFNFVSNLVDGMIQGATTDAAIGEIINIGAAEEITIRDLITTIRDATGSSSELRLAHYRRDRPKSRG